MITLNAIDKAKKVATAFIDLFKMWDTLDHNFLPTH